MNGTANPRYLAYRLTLEAPLIITSRHGDPYGAGTHPFIAGSALRGVIANRLLSRGISAESEGFRLLVLSGKLRYLNAYPEVHGMRALPTPVSWRVSKSDIQRGWDLAYFPAGLETSDADEAGDPSWPEEQLQAPGAPFVSPSVASGFWMTVAPTVNVRIHNQRDRVKGRAWKDEREMAHGTIFAYEYLEPGQAFHGVIQLMPGTEGCEDRLGELLAHPILIGRSRRAGYGGDARVEFLGSTPREFAGATSLLARDLAAGERFRILLVSSCITRHPETGQPDPLAIEEEIKARLEGAVRIERRRWAFETVGGFNQKWGVELPQGCALRAGSVFVTRALEPLALQELLALEHAGLGERRTEGFGRLVLLAYDEAAREIRLSSAPRESRAPRPAPPTDARAGGLLDFLERRILLEAAERELRHAAWSLAESAKNIPSNALLGRIRTLLREGQEEDNAASTLEKLRGWVKQWHGEGALSRKRAAEQLAECAFGGRKLLDWLGNLLSAENDRWQALRQAAGEAAQLGALSQKCHVRTRETAQAELERHAAHLTVVLLDELMGALAHKNRGR